MAIEIKEKIFDEMSEYYRSHMQHLKKINKTIYWLDLFLTALFAWTLFVLACQTKNMFLSIVFLGMSSIFFYRGLSFVHEVTHHAPHIKGYRVAWNLLFGMAFLYPSYVYENHLLHHRMDHYGSSKDAEYFIINKKLSGLFRFLFWGQFVMPAKLIIRSLIFPLVFISEKFSNFYEMHLCGFYLNPEYEKKPLSKRIKKNLYKEDLRCTLFAYMILGLIFAHQLPAYIILYWYSAAFILSFINSIRVVVCTHNYNYLSPRDRAEQIIDTFTLDKGLILPGLIAPIGLRYHALHHLFPGIPYHSLGKAHRMVCEAFPNNTAYKDTFTSIPQQLRKYTN
ncbi:MAG: fatty acid desaturase [Legionella sp.]|uniref:fatty acid desaturase n=1 Tax=Legionella sp. TaxID=459 RepID=UPI002842C78D|nr:fatty acid desaturase [Legionella sp.]